MMIFIWLIVGLGVYWLIAGDRNGSYKTVRNTTAEDTLKRRYVNGEIDEETYFRMLKIINE